MCMRLCDAHAFLTSTPTRLPKHLHNREAAASRVQEEWQQRHTQLETQEATIRAEQVRALTMCVDHVR